jgi:hypothetical protein
MGLGLAFCFYQFVSSQKASPDSDQTYDLADA